MSVIKTLMLALAAAMMMSASASANVIYDLTLTGSPYSGSGVLTLNAPVNPSGQQDVLGTVVSLSFTIDGQTFDYPGSGASLTVVRFFNGALNDITFAQQIGVSPNRYALFTTAGFTFDYGDTRIQENGQMTATLETAAVSEPTGLAMLGVGLLGLAGLGFVQRRMILAKI